MQSLPSGDHIYSINEGVLRFSISNDHCIMHRRPLGFLCSELDEPSPRSDTNANSYILLTVHHEMILGK